MNRPPGKGSRPTARPGPWVLLAAWGPCGYAPFAPGTFGTLGAIPLYAALSRLPSFAYVAFTIAFSGLTALGAEVVWTRILSLHFGGTVYTFALILAVFLIGLGIGSTAGAGMARSVEHPRRALGWCQLFICAAMAWAAYQLTESLPYWPINPSISTDPWFTFQLDLVRSLWVVLPAAILWGASFPLALASVALPGQDPARLLVRQARVTLPGTTSMWLKTMVKVPLPWVSDFSLGSYSSASASGTMASMMAVSST